MTISVQIDLGYEFEVRAKFDEVFAVLSDVPKSVSHFPKVRKLTHLENGVYQCEMQRVGTPQIHIQTVYACQYVADQAKGTVRWTPVEGVGNAQVRGHWKITDHKGRSTKVVFHTEGTVTVPFPALMRPVIAPLVASEFEKLVEKYIANLVEAFGGEV
jgi:carbon monoxide dehydrogenase subunit G